MKRVCCYVDGYNLYHAIDEMGANHYKWLDLWKLAMVFIDPNRHRLDRVYYFSAYATWRPGSYRRHREYVKAIQIQGVTPVLGKFYQKPSRCNSCGHSWVSHEEKNSDVNTAVFLLDGAYQDEYDRAILISRDSDVTMAVSRVSRRFPEKEVVIVAPPNQRHSMELARRVPRARLKRIKEVHLRDSLLPEKLYRRNLSAVRPARYAPPIRQ